MGAEGKNLTKSLGYPLYALIKLSPFGDVTELLTFTGIISFLIKSSVYLHYCVYLLKNSLPQKGENTRNALLPCTYLTVPILFIILTIIFKDREYGSLQNLIYPCSTILSLLFTLTYLTNSKKE